MMDETSHEGMNPEESTTQVGCCAAADCTSKPQRLSLRARLERERDERAQRRQASFISTFRNLFSTSSR